MKKTCVFLCLLMLLSIAVGRADGADKVAWKVVGGIPRAVTEVASARAAAPDCDFVFAVVGDNQPKGLFGQPEVFRKIVGAVNKSRPAFVVHVGDTIQGHKTDTGIVRRQYAEYLSVAKNFAVPVYYTPGNHEINGSKKNDALFKETLGCRLYYSFIFGNCLFIVLDSEQPGSEGKIEREQLTWLKEQLEQATDKAEIFVFMHRALFSILKSGKSGFDPANRILLADLFKKHNVTVLFAGHEHLYDSREWDGLLQIVSGNGGAPFHPYPQGNFHGFLLVKVFKHKVLVEVRPML